MRRALVYDGSFDGFLTAVFTVYNEKLEEVDICASATAQIGLFGESQKITTLPDRAARVWKKVTVACGKVESLKLYKAFLKEETGMENRLLYYIRQAIKAYGQGLMDKLPAGDMANPVILEINKAAKMVGREKHRMEAFIRFHLIDDDLYYANCEPDFNVLPLIAPHFKRRYADQKWIIYDLKRNYGLSYDFNQVQMVHFSDGQDADKPRILDNSTLLELPEEERAFQKMWNEYFKSTNIESRKNMRLHVRHVPKRYWKYLSEKV